MRKNDYIDECLKKIEDKIPLSLEEYNYIENLLHDLWHKACLQSKEEE